MLVVGIIYGGIGLNYWLDMQRIANQGARWAAVNNWPPDCPVNASTCPSPNTLQESLERMALSRGLEGTVNAEVCFPTGNKNVGDSVRVRLTAPYNFFFIDSFQVELVGEATMRLEQEPDLIENELAPCP